MHLQGHEIRKIRAFLNHTVHTTLADVETLDDELVRAFKDWVHGVRGITGHDGSFPSRTESTPSVIVEFEFEEVEGEESYEKLEESEESAPPLPAAVLAADTPELLAEVQRLLAEAEATKAMRAQANVYGAGQAPAVTRGPDSGVVTINALGDRAAINFSTDKD